jgi:UDP-N-acetylglucosamine:LPS N-acetylglucosamine transferase
MRLRPAFRGHQVVYATVSEHYRAQVGAAPFRLVSDATRWHPHRAMVLFIQVFRLLARERPDVVVTTGALPGLVAVALGRLLGATTVWIDSLANVDELSMSGRQARWFSHVWLTQWQHLAVEGGPEYVGSVME